MTDLELALKVARDTNMPAALRDKAKAAISAALDREAARNPEPPPSTRRRLFGAILK